MKSMLTQEWLKYWILLFNDKPETRRQLGSNEDAAKIAIDVRLVRKHLEQLNIYKLEVPC